MNKVPRWVFRYVGNKTFDFSSKKKDFLPKNDQIWPKIGIFGQFGPGHAGLFGALLVGRLVVVARRLYLARHLFTLLYFPILCKIISHHSQFPQEGKDFRVVSSAARQPPLSAVSAPLSFATPPPSSPSLCSSTSWSLWKLFSTSL